MIPPRCVGRVTAALLCETYSEEPASRALTPLRGTAPPREPALYHDGIVPIRGEPWAYFSSWSHARSRSRIWRRPRQGGLARENPELKVNAVTPGFIATDLTTPFAEARGQTPQEMGMKTPHEGATATLHLLFGALEGNAWYYGSDAERSPLHRYRAPGDPPYTGEG